MERSSEEVERDAAINEAARGERLRADGQRSLGENLERAAALIRAASELARGLNADAR
jgi:hypothetical protein